MAYVAHVVEILKSWSRDEKPRPRDVYKSTHDVYDLKQTYNFWPLEAYNCTFIWNRTFTLNLQVVSHNVQKVQKVRQVRINRTKGTPRTHGTMLITKNTYYFHILTFLFLVFAVVIFKF